MKLLERLRKEFEIPVATLKKRTKEDIIKDIEQAAIQGKFYTFCEYQVEYKSLTGHYYKVSYLKESK
jgi:hypothetical protein